MALLKHGGAAGGVAAGLNTFLNAKLVNGIDYFLDITGFNQLLLNADLVITGEGSIDVQTLHGKGPFGVAARAKQRSIPVIGLGGVVTHSETLQQYFDRLIPINRAADIEIAMKETYRNLVLAAKGLGEELNIHSLL